MAAVGGHSQVSDGRIFRFTTAVAENGGVVVVVGQLDSVEGLGQGTDLIDLNEDGIGGGTVYAALQGKNEKLIMESVSKRRLKKIIKDAKSKEPFTHEIARPFGAVYYLSGPQQARPPEGRFKPGTRVWLVRKNGSYSVVQSENGITAHVATGALKTIGE